MLLAGAAFALYWLLGRAVGLIPFHGGAGFDGAVYIEYLQKIAAGEPVPGDPYRLMRLPGFLPALLAAKLGLPAADMVSWQRSANMLLLSAGLGLMFDALRRSGQPARRAALVVAALGLAWPYALMPGYAPVLSDHLALFMATLALWAWMRRLRWLLALLVPASFWVLPGLFVLPAALLALPFDARRVAGEHGRSRRVFWITCAGLLLALVWVWLVAAGVPAAVIDHHPPGTTLGKSALRPLTLLLIGVALAASALIGARLLSAQTFWRSLCPHGVAGALLLALLGGATVWFGLDWGGGYQGPPLHHHLLLQGLAAPAKPLVAHFVYFGPLFVLAVAALACRLDDLLEGGLAAPAAVCVAFLPLLMFASESRQWIWLLPVMALLTAATARTCALWWQLVFSLALLVPALWLRTATQADARADAGMLADGWQLYFGRQGPWMGDRVYVAGGALLVLFVLGLAGARARRRRGGRCRRAR